jgi:hypothetical protein
MNDEGRLNISPGYEKLLSSLKRKHPTLSDQEAEKLRNDLIGNLSERMEDGFTPAAVKWNEDGSIDLRIMNTDDIIDDRVEITVMAKNYFNVTPMGRRLLSQAGNTILYESAFRIEQTSEKTNNSIHITSDRVSSRLLGGDYITIEDAIKMSGLNEEELIEICERESIEIISYGDITLISQGLLAQHVPLTQISKEEKKGKD